jgi:hypothetical protein
MPEMFDDFLSQGENVCVAIAGVASFLPVSQMLPVVKDYGT